MNLSVNLIIWLHRGGQVHSVSLLRELLGGLGCRVRLIVTARQSPGEHLRADVNLFSSEVHPAWLPLATRNVLIPNPEQDVRQSSAAVLRPGRFNETRDQLRYLRELDKLLVKTRAAEATLGALGLPVAYAGFASRDRYEPDGAGSSFATAGGDRDAGWLCVIGDNHWNKELPPVLRAWGRNPDLPRLTVVLRDPAEPPPALPNVTYRVGHLPDVELRALQNRCRVHVCPSAMEGWGHALVEAMSTGALVITADAAPMNEHVGEGRGALYAVTDPTPHAFAVKHRIDEASLEATARHVAALPEADRRARGEAARLHFLAGREAFERNFRREWHGITAGL